MSNQDRLQKSPAVGWLIDAAGAFLLGGLLTIVGIVAAGVYAITREKTVNIAGILMVTVDERGGFEASTGAYVPLAIAAMTFLVLIVIRLIRSRLRGTGR